MVNISITNVVPTPVILFKPVWAGTNFIFSFESQTGGIYDVQYADPLGSSNWLLLMTLMGDGSTLNVTNQNPTNATRFYRIESR